MKIIKQTLLLFFRNKVREVNYFSWRNMKQATAQKRFCVDDWRSKAYHYWGGKLASQRSRGYHYWGRKLASQRSRGHHYWGGKLASQR